MNICNEAGHNWKMEIRQRGVLIPSYAKTRKSVKKGIWILNTNFFGIKRGLDGKTKTFFQRK